jgi:hypothetical protein
LQEFKESFIEILIITKVCLTTFWFWLPALFAAYIYFQLWAVFFVHPLTILIMPIVLAAFSMIWEEKNAKDQYGLDEIKLLSASDPLGANPEWKKVRWDVEKAIKEYKETLRNAEEKKEEEKS